MKTLLLHPPVGRDVPPDQRSDSLSVGYIAAVLQRDGHEVEVLDAALLGISERETVRAALSREFDCIGITATHDQKRFLTGLAREVRERRKDALIIAGGYLPTLSAERLLAVCPEIDFLVRGEGEAATADVFGRMARGEDWRDTPGIACLKDGQPVLNPLPPLIEDLDSLPFPDRSSLATGPAEAHACVTSSRGCYHKCSFCCINTFYELSGGQAPRFRSPASFVDEIESVIAATDKRDFMFIDDDFLGPGRKTQERALEIAREIRVRNLGIRFTIECRADELEDDILNALKEAGLTGVFLGVESGVQRQLDTYNKHLTVEQNRRGIEVARRCGVEMKAGMILFDPYTTLAEVEENQRFIREMGLTNLSLESRVTLFQGVPLADRVRDDGLLKEIDGIDLDYDFRDPQVRLMWRVTKASAGMSEFVRALKRRLLGRSR